MPAADSGAGDGILLVDKERGWTSHDVVSRVRRIAGTRRVGHAGTLDPLATGVLLVGVNRATRLLTFLVGCDKTYEATIRLGQASTTDDADGELLPVAPPPGVRRADLEHRLPAVLQRFTGELEQVPSAVSAIKVDGRRAYARVRAGEDVQLAARPVVVKRLDLLAVREAASLDGVSVLDVDVRLEVSSGTYVRAIARDVGAALGCGGHLTALRRTVVGPFHVEDCHSVEELRDLAEAGGGTALPLLSPAQAARAVLPVAAVSDEEARMLRQGKTLPGTRACPALAAICGEDLVAVVTDDGERVRSRCVFPVVPAAPRPAADRSDTAERQAREQHRSPARRRGAC